MLGLPLRPAAPPPLSLPSLTQHAAVFATHSGPAYAQPAWHEDRVGLPCGALVCKRTQISAVKKVLQNHKWLKVGMNVTRFDPAAHAAGRGGASSSSGSPPATAASATPAPTGARHPLTDAEAAVHVNLVGAAALEQAHQPFLPPGATGTPPAPPHTLLPDDVGSLLRDGLAGWAAALRVFSPACDRAKLQHGVPGAEQRARKECVALFGGADGRADAGEEAEAKDGGRPCRFVELFAGIGGFRVGLEALGAQAVFASELDKEARQLYAANFGEAAFGDILQIEHEDIPDHDILTAGFPCQSFSRTGEEKGFGDPRGMLFLEIVRVLRAKKPRAFLLENVSNLIYIDDGHALRIILDALRKCGYDVTWRLINLRALLPQQRQRIYIVGFRQGAGGGGAGATAPGAQDGGARAGPGAGAGAMDDFEWPAVPVLESRLSDVLEPGRHNDPALMLSEHQYTKIKQGSEGGDWHARRIADPDGSARTLLSSYKTGYAMRSEFVAAPAPAAEGGGPGACSLRPRFYSPRECARLQGFPHWFRTEPAVVRNENRVYHQVGNAVSPVMVAAIGGAMMAAMRCPVVPPRRPALPDCGDARRQQVKPALDLLLEVHEYTDGRAPSAKAAATFAKCADFLRGRAAAAPSSASGAVPLPYTGYGGLLTAADTAVLSKALAAGGQAAQICALHCLGRAPVDTEGAFGNAALNTAAMTRAGLVPLLESVIAASASSKEVVRLCELVLKNMRMQQQATSL